MRGLRGLGSPVRARSRLGGCWEWVRASEAVRGRFPLGGGNDEEGGREWRRDGAGCNDGAVHGEIPAASAGMTEEVRRV